MKFKDLNFKLMVINTLMFEMEILKPRFDRESFAKKHGIKNCHDIDMLEEPVVKSYFEELPMSAEDLAKIEEIHQDGGDMIYMELCPPDWGGEDDRYWLKSAKDLALLPNLKSITVVQPADDDLVDTLNKEFAPFEKKGLNAVWG